MQPDDPRHGTYAGVVEHYFTKTTPCAPCQAAGAEYRRKRRTRLYLAKTNTLMVPALGTTRRIQALVALGHTMSRIDAEVGRKPGYTSIKLKRYQDTIQASTDAVYRAAYDRLCMIRPEGEIADRTRIYARKRGWVTPLAWDDIDNDPAPADKRIPCIRKDCAGGVVALGLCRTHYNAQARGKAA